MKLMLLFWCFLASPSKNFAMCLCNISSTPRWMFIGLEFFGIYICSCKILFLDILSLLVHLKEQGESNYKCNRCCYFDVFLHLPVRILHICCGMKIKKKNGGWLWICWKTLHVFGCPNWTIIFQLYSHGRISAFFGYPNKKEDDLQLYIYGMISSLSRCSNWKKMAQHGLKYELQIFKTHYRYWGVQALEFIQSGAFIVDVQAHKIVQSKNGKHERKPHKMFPNVNNWGPYFEPLK